MTDIKEIEKTIASLYQARKSGPAVEMPPFMQARALIGFANAYIDAASIIDHHGHQHWLPAVNLTGHAVECSLKACIAAAGNKVKHGHNLVELYEQAVMCGFGLSDSEIASVIHLNHHYYSDLETGTRYKSRFPTTTDEPLGGAMPQNETFVSIVRSLTEQAEKRSKEQERDWLKLKG